jgi:hypothetical protein
LLYVVERFINRKGNAMRKLGWMCALSLVAGNALAIPVTWEAHGEITYVEGDYTGEIGLPSYAQLGDEFSYAITFDNETPGIQATYDIVRYPGAIQSVIFTARGKSYDLPLSHDANTSADHLSTLDTGYGEGHYNFVFRTSPAGINDRPALTSSFSMLSVLADINPMRSPSPPSDLTDVYSYVQLEQYKTDEQRTETGQGPGISGRIDSIKLVSNPVSVPEPTSLALFAIGLFGTGVGRRKKRT